MSGLTLGMNPDEVEATGRELQRRADEIRAQVGATDRSVSSLPWRGRDAERFKTQWWPEHRGRLLAAADDLHGLGQSALNNASEQRQKSGGGGTGVTPPTVGGGIAGPGDGSSFGDPPIGIVRSPADAKAAYDANYVSLGLNHGRPGTEDEYQCVSWAWFRMKELGYGGPQGPVGTGGRMAEVLGGSADTVPERGAVISIPGSMDHVRIAEDITVNADGTWSVRVSEMNVGRTDANPSGFHDDKVMTYHPDTGLWDYKNYGNHVGQQCVTFNPDYG